MLLILSQVQMSVGEEGSNAHARQNRVDTDTFKSLRIRAGDSRFCEPPVSTEGARQKNLDYT